MRIMLLLMLTVLLLGSQPSVAQEVTATYSFGYVYQAQQGEIGIETVDPTTSPVSTNVLKVPIEASWSLADAAQGVGHEWIALAFRVGPAYVMRLVNLTSSEIRDVAAGFLLSPSPDAIMGPQQEFVWSPDGHYLAFNTFSNETGLEPRTDTFLYSLVENQTFRLTDDAALQTRLAWSPDSRYLAIATVTCSEECGASIDLFDPVTRNRTTSSSITSGAFGANSMGRAGVCHLNWSPDGRYISFMANCDGLEYGYYKEMYLLEVSSGALTQITDFTYQQEVIEPFYSVFADYEPIWVDTEILLISVIQGIGELSSETFEYNVTTGTLRKVSDQYVTEWAVNPVSQALAFRSIGTNPDLDAYQRQRQSQPVEIAPLEALSEATAATELLPASITASAGCDLSWSPDGTILAYSMPSGEVCLSAPQSFGFINSDRGAVTQYVPTFEGGEPFTLMALGWVSN